MDQIKGGDDCISSVRNCTGFLCCDPDYSDLCRTLNDRQSCDKVK